MPERAHTWIAAEPGLAQALYEVRRLSRRAFRRPARVIGLALALAILLAAKKAQTGLDESFSSQLLLRITENDVDENTTSSRPPREFKRWVTGAAFSGPRLLKLIEKHRLYPSDFKRGPQFAIEAMRDDIDVVVWRNFFLWANLPEGEGDAERRSVRISIGYHARDPELAFAVTQDLGQLIIDLQEQSRRALAEEARLEAEAAADEARGAFTRARERLIRRQLALIHATPTESALLKVELASLRTRMKFLEGRTANLDRLKGRIGLQEGIERQSKGLVFEIIDHGSTQEAPQLTKREVLILVGILSFVGLIPLCALVLGAFDSRILVPDDVRRLGLSALGLIPRFDGDDFGSLDMRRRSHHGVHSKARIRS